MSMYTLNLKRKCKQDQLTFFASPLHTQYYLIINIIIYGSAACSPFFLLTKESYENGGNILYPWYQLLSLLV